MVRGRLERGSGGYRVSVDPDPKSVADDIGRFINKPMKREVGKLHRKLGDVPIREIRKRANQIGSGRVRIGRAVKPSATVRDLTINAGAGYPDFAGQEWGSKRYGQFAPFKPDGYVIGAMMDDAGFMESFMGDYVDGLSDLLEKVWNGRG